MKKNVYTFYSMVINWGLCNEIWLLTQQNKSYMISLNAIFYYDIEKFTSEIYFLISKQV